MWQFAVLGDDAVEQDPTQSAFFNTADVDRSESLVREPIQNSLDARISSTEPVTVAYRFREADPRASEGLAKFLEGLGPHLQACDVTLDGIDLARVPHLLIEDFGTHGLRGDPDSRDAGDFAFFWHKYGISNKGGKSAGRWGLGKSILANSSRIGAFMGLTIRSDDGRALLMGQAVLRNHRIAGKRYVPYGFLTASDPGEFQRPFEDAATIKDFKARAGLERKKESGFSIVVPLPREDITEDSLIEAAIVHYYYPIITGSLVVKVNDKTVDQNTVHELAASSSSVRLQKMAPLFDFVRQVASIPAEAIMPVDQAEALESGKISKDAFSPETLEMLTKAYGNGDIVAVRVPAGVTRKTGPARPTYFDLFIKRGDDGLERGIELYIRGGITITGQKGFGARRALGLLLAQDDEISQFLGDSENPAHTQWIETAEKLVAKYKSPRTTLRFVRNALIGLLDTLAVIKQERDKKALESVFFLETGREPRKPRTTPAAPKIEGAGPGKIAIAKTAGGFAIRKTGKLSADDLPMTVDVRAAYDIRRGNPFAKYDPNDFRLDRGPIAFRYTGVNYMDRKENSFVFTIEKPEFTLDVSGFDLNRDLIVTMTVRGD